MRGRIEKARTIGINLSNAPGLQKGSVLLVSVTASVRSVEKP
jgi:hypothetical protein